MKISSAIQLLLYIVVSSGTVSASCQYVNYKVTPSYTFPPDFGAHFDQQIEWWWMMGVLNTTDGSTFGVGIYVTRLALNITCGRLHYNFWNFEFTVMNPQGDSDETRHLYFHKHFYLPPFSVTDNFTSSDSLNEECRTDTVRCDKTDFLGESRAVPPFHLIGSLFGFEFYKFQQSDSNERNFTFKAVALDEDIWNTQTSIGELVLRDVQGGQPIASSGIISPITLNQTVSATIQLDQTRLQPVIEVGNEPQLTVLGKKYSIKEGLFYNSHQWLTPLPNTPSSTWIWFWLSLFDEEQTTIAICRLPPYAQHVATNVVTVSKIDNPDGMAPLRHNRVYAGTHDVYFNATSPWISNRSNNTYYTEHHFRVFPAGLDLHIKAYVDDSEFGYRAAEMARTLFSKKEALPQVFYYEGAGRVWGTKNGKPVWGVGFIETYNNFYTTNSPNYPPV